MDKQSATDPSGAPASPPPAWRWETSASLVLLIVVFFLSFAPSLRDQLESLLPPYPRLILLGSLSSFGLVLGYSGARQAGASNRAFAIIASALNLFFMYLNTIVIKVEIALSKCLN